MIWLVLAVYFQNGRQMGVISLKISAKGKSQTLNNKTFAILTGGT
ncbi:MAG: hypothetical protein WCR53_03055 [Bacteroidaceae bacterium]|nr:hypothetical protein [Bacteroidaceae bacterium]